MPYSVCFGIEILTIMSISNKYFLPIVSAVLLVSVVGLSIYCKYLNNQLAETQEKLQQYVDKDGETFVIERISKQMEDIAYQQKDIAEHQREEALFQMGQAQTMRAKAETEQRKAQEFANNAVEARKMAELQREKAIEQQLIAEDEQLKAEYAKSVADTLSYKALARTLALLSTAQYKANNTDIASLLAYASWKLMTDYKGSAYQPAIFNALSQFKFTTLSRNIHKGSITRICNVKGKTCTYYSSSEYGEISRYNYDYEKKDIVCHPLFFDETYSFRDMCIDENEIIYALSFDGRLLINNGKQNLTIQLPETSGFTRLCLNGNKHLMVFSYNNYYLFDIETRSIEKFCPLNGRPSAITRKGNSCLVFCQNHDCYEIGEDGVLTTVSNDIKGNVTAASWNNDLQILALGFDDGEIGIYDNNYMEKSRLLAHQSQISQLDFIGSLLFSSSYDCTLALCDALKDKQEPVVMAKRSEWIKCFCIGDDNTIWIGDHTGTVTHVMTSPDKMAQTIQNQLSRDMTDEEWQYYLGNNIPRFKLK